ncbi:Putative acetyltransferase protein, GNAT family [Neorhizobium galegae bv. officinalis]|jgi:GNAT superfamily N-acetyltransferase|uniref:Putative acetyltransferase protein, GNAT family n=1 Tax=Neorhizobium galegae bv. officinalis TaxID=323656 RepID=A0A0T7FAF1_NEOGA|nr:GNAT family N-acetyltransferase [Neorhizobium galegae]CDZ32005.1 Putative acetyltransferase protein, GNAT family [Neorhizobium galegae bv. officinalis]
MVGIVIATLGEPLPADIVSLADAAERGGYAHIRRLVEEWSTATNRFEGRGERLLGAYDGQSLVAVGGMTIEFSRPDWLRMRRFYVLPDYQSRGIGRMLAAQLLDHARAFTTVVTVQAGDGKAGLFWQAMGFRPQVCDTYTHVLELG